MAPKNAKEPHSPCGSSYKKCIVGLTRVFFSQVPLFDELFDFAPFVAVFLGFHWTVVDLAERVFGVSDDFSECI